MQLEEQVLKQREDMDKSKNKTKKKENNHS